MSSNLELNEAQLTAARATAWHQTADPILTLDAARTWLTESGLVLFAPRASQLPAPAPSFVEATLGVANAAPTAVETDGARHLLGRLVADGLVLPLNLLGIPGDSPDFVVSAQVFSYIFTLRGDKNWKQPPATSGAIAVSPLGLHIYEVLTERGALTAAELATELGREVTETAIQRSLTELWSQLRVLPLLQMDGAATLWELTTRRFTKAIKAGANAGQPTALSALISLYLAQVFAATEEEIATFLSPLTARSRVREVVHALVGARQLETVVLEGKTLVHVPGALRAVVPETAVPLDDVAGEGDAVVQPVTKPKKIGTGRISSFRSEEKAVGEFRGKAAGEFRRKPAPSSNRGAAGKRAVGGFVKSGGARPTSRFGGAAGARAGGRPEAERRPFKKDAAAQPSFTRPWEEEQKPKAAGVKDGFTKFRRPEPEDRKPLGPREQAGLPVERRTPARSATKSFERKPFAGKPGVGAKAGAGGRPYAAKAFGAKPFGEKPFGAKPGGAGKRPYVRKTSEAGETAKPTFKPRAYEAKETFAPKERKPYAAKSFAAKSLASKPFASKPFASKPFAARADKPGFGAKRSFSAGAGEGGERPAYAPRTSAAKPYGAKVPGGKSFGAKPFGAKPYAARGGEAKPKRAYASRRDDAAPFEAGPVERTLPKRPYKPRAADADKRPFNKDPWVAPTEESGGKRPAKRGFGGGARKPFGSKPGGKSGAKPFAAKRGAGSASRPSSRTKPTAE